MLIQDPGPDDQLLNLAWCIIKTTSLIKSFGWDSTEVWQQYDIQELCRVMFDVLEQKFKNIEQADLINRLYQDTKYYYMSLKKISFVVLSEII